MLYNNRKDKSSIDEKKVSEVLRSINFKFNKLTPIGISYTNNVFLIEDDEREYIIKFFTDQWVDKNSGKNEYEILLLLKKMDFPVPKVLLFRNADDVSPRNYMIMERIDGAAMSESMNSITSETIDECIMILRKFQNLYGKFGFFRHDEMVHKTYENHFDFINDAVYSALKKVKDLRYNVYDLKELFDKQRQFDTDASFLVFTHNDFSPKHIFVRYKKVVGLIDFERSIFSEPISDAILFLTSLAEYNPKKQYLVKVLDYCCSIANPEKLAYYAARAFIIKAAWPHKAVPQPYYSQTCLDKAKDILDRGFLELNDLFWSENLGVIK